MPGFGDEAFGEYSFGEYNWPRRVTYDSLPTKWRDRDEAQGYPLRDFLTGYEEELDEVRIKVRRIPDQRNPLVAIATERQFTVNIDGSEVIQDEFWGKTVLVTISNGEDISDLGQGYTCIVENPADPSDIRTYTVVRIRERNEPDTRNEVLLRGVPLELVNTEVTFRHPSMLKNLAGDWGVLIDDAEPIQFQRSQVANAVKLRAIKSNEKSYAVRGDMAGFVVEAIGLYRFVDSALDLPAGSVFELPAGSGQFYTSLKPQRIKYDEIPADVRFDDPDAGTVSLVDNDLLFFDNSGDGKNPALAYSENVLAGYFDGFANPADLISWVSSTAVSDSDPFTDSGATTVPAFDGIETEFEIQISKAPVVAGSVTVDTSAGVGSEDFTDNGDGTLNGDNGGGGLIDYQTGVVNLTYGTAPAGGLTVDVGFGFDTKSDIAAGDTLYRVALSMTQEQRNLIGYISKGVFILENDLTGEEHYIEAEDSFAGGVWTVFTATDPGAGDYKVKYVPTIRTSCDWCRSNVMVLRIENTQALVDGFNGDGSLVQAAFERMLIKLKKLIPIHVRLGAVVKKISFTVTGPPQSVSLSIATTVAMTASFQAYYDIIPADEIFTDSLGPGGQVSLTVTTTP